jgi:F-type H+-transporting ATPase subunit gamma
MKMVSAAKLRKAQDAITQLRPYAVKLNQMLKNILSNADDGVSNPFGTSREVKKALIVVVTSNRGLAGAFNSNVIKAAVRSIETVYADVRSNGNLTILCIGKKGFDFFRKYYKDCTLIRDHVNLFQDLSFNNTSLVATSIMDAYAQGEYDAVDVAYGVFKNPATQFASLVSYLPVEIEKSQSKSRANYIFEPGQETLLQQLVPNILQIQFQRFLLDTQASEHGARMTAMDKATENAEEMIKELRINYNKARQEAITKELSEIVGGAAALEG